MQAPHVRRYSLEEYFALDEAAPQGVRLEYDEGTIYLNGQVYDPEWGWEQAVDMAGAHPDHIQVASNVTIALRRQLDGRGCRTAPSDQRVAVGSGQYVYPDVAMSCHPNYDGVILLNPELAVEVLSRSSLERDLRDKVLSYQRIPSLVEYWAIWYSVVLVTRYFRTEKRWEVASYSDLEDRILSERLGIEVPLDEIYRGIELV